MKALYLTHHFKSAADIRLSVAERPAPHGECIVRVHSSGVNVSDGLGAIGSFPHAKLPRIPGRDFAGTLPDGTAVWGTGGSLGIDSDGAHAELLALPRDAIAPIPRNLTLFEASLQTLPYVTAYYSLFQRARLAEGQRVLVLGAHGQVGQAALSLCRWTNCPVTAYARSARLAALRAQGWAATDGIPDGPFDVILNAIGNSQWDDWIRCLAPGGRMIVIAAPEGKRDVKMNLFPFYRANQELHGINSVPLNIVENAAMLRAMTPGFESGALTPLKAAVTYCLEEASLAYQAVLTGSSGRVALLT